MSLFGFYVYYQAVHTYSEQLLLGTPSTWYGLLVPGTLCTRFSGRRLMTTTAKMVFVINSSRISRFIDFCKGPTAKGHKASFSRRSIRWVDKMSMLAEKHTMITVATLYYRHEDITCNGGKCPAAFLHQSFVSRQDDLFRLIWYR